MVSIKRKAAVTDFLRESPPKLLQTVPVLPAANFGILGQSKPVFTPETTLLLGSPHLNNGESRFTPHWLPDLWWSQRLHCTERKVPITSLPEDAAPHF